MFAFAIYVHMLGFSIGTVHMLGLGQVLLALYLSNSVVQFGISVSLHFSY